MNQETDSNSKFTVFVGGLNFQTDETSLENFFSLLPQISGIENVRICRRIEGTSKGFGYVTFNNKSSFIQSLALNGNLLDGKSIRIEADNSKKLFISSRNKNRKSSNSYTPSTQSSPIKKKKSKPRSGSSESSSYSSYSYSYSYSSSYSSPSSSYSTYSSDTEKKNQNSHRKNKKRKRRNYSDYSYSS